MGRILDLTNLAAIYGTRLLVEGGHDVIRVESPQGDEIRHLGPFVGDTLGLEHGVYHRYLNAGKRSLSLDPASAAGREVLLALAARSDAIVASASLPIEPDELAATNRGLSIVVVEDGTPELCLAARTGLLSLVGRPGRAPLQLGGHLIYANPGLYVGLAVQLALMQAGRTGVGQRVTVSVEQCMESMLEQAMIEYTFTGKGVERRGNRGTVTATSGALPCKDGYWLLSLIHRDEGWLQLMDWMQDPVLMADPSLVHEENRHKQRDFILDRIEQWASQYTRTELVAEAQRRHIPASPISLPVDTIGDPQLQARGFFAAVEDPEAGRVMLPRGPIANVLNRTVGLAPRLGQDNTSILDELGYSRLQQQALMESGAL